MFRLIKLSVVFGLLFYIVLQARGFSQSSFCIAGVGYNCEEAVASSVVVTSKEKKVSPKVSPSPSTAPIVLEDGGAARKREAGDKTEHQGYSDYVEHFVEFSWGIVSSPMQNGKRSSEVSNRGLSYEYAFNPYLSVKNVYWELGFNGFDGNDIDQNHFGSMLLLRIYPRDYVVLKAGGGILRSEVEVSGGENKGSHQGMTQVVHIVGNRYFGNENWYLGGALTYIDGNSDALALGSTVFDIHVGVGF